ncbi:hypothetical protein M513_12517 [Trichuris suis]|uniref:cyclin-dependent kinase n=1 Tax=Trichuris suis TaxID=68888 RepID=A0A085LNS2_9BILA|nr:hypothetical protein M513_12517 [Trichuris suis]
MLDGDEDRHDDNKSRKNVGDAAQKSVPIDDLEDDAALRAALLASRRFARKQHRPQEEYLVDGGIEMDSVKKKKDEEVLKSPSRPAAQAVSSSDNKRSDAQKWSEDKKRSAEHRGSDRKERRSDTGGRREHQHVHRKDEHRHEKSSQKQPTRPREKNVHSDTFLKERRTPRAEQQHRNAESEDDEAADVEETVNFMEAGETFITLSSESSPFKDTSARSEHGSTAEATSTHAAGSEAKEERSSDGSTDNVQGESFHKDEAVVDFDVSDVNVATDGDSNESDRQVAPDVGHSSGSSNAADECSSESVQLPIYCPAVMGCRSVDEFHCLNRIEEGTYGVVYRALEKRTGEVVALKRLKMEKEKDGFPITALREVNMLLKSRSHPNIVNVREIVVGSNMDKIYLVMEYVEHDLKSLMDSMKQPFLVGEVKTLMYQLLSGIHHLHDNWILHRDLKTSNLLLSHRGILKIGDFGLAREYGSPLKPYTPVVVTLWYRAPELLLGVKEYSTAIDLWSVGCIFAELLTLKPLFPGRTEVEQLNRFFKMLGTPNEETWPGYSELPVLKRTHFVECPFNQLRKHFGATLSDTGFQLLSRFLTYYPKARISALEASRHSWFVEEPRPVHPSLFPTWPAKSELVKVSSSDNKRKSDSAGDASKPAARETEKDLLNTLRIRPHQSRTAGFTLKFDAVKF